MQASVEVEAGAAVGAVEQVEPVERGAQDAAALSRTRDADRSRRRLPIYIASRVQYYCA